jgi:type IV secretion system protein VirD4
LGGIKPFAEYLPPTEKDGHKVDCSHIISVFKLVQDLLAPSKVKGKSQFQLLMDKLPSDHKARRFAGAALNSAEQAMALEGQTRGQGLVCSKTMK